MEPSGHEPKGVHGLKVERGGKDESFRRPSPDFPLLKDRQILELAAGSGAHAEWAKVACDSLGLQQPLAGVDLGERGEELFLVPAGYEEDSRRPNTDFPDLDGEQIIALAKGDGPYSEWAKWAEKELGL